MKYCIYGIVLECDEPLAELEELTTQVAEPAQRVEGLQEPAQGVVGFDEPVQRVGLEALTEPVRLLSSVEAGPCMPGAVLLPPLPNAAQATWPAIWRNSEGYGLRFDDQATFWVAASGRSIHWYRSSAPRETQLHLLLDHVLPRALYLLGAEPLHATAVAVRGRVVAFLAETGTGKSTLAAALAASGCELVADDCLVLTMAEGKVLAAPGYAGLRLYPDARAAVCPEATASQLAHYTDKQRVSGFVSLARHSLPVSAIYTLTRREGSPAQATAEVEALGQADAVMALTAHAFRMDIEPREPLKRQLRFFSRVATTVPVRRCRVPSDLSKLPEVAQHVLKDAFD